MLSKDGGEFFGALGFNSLGACAELAYHLRPDFWGKDIMTEACLAAIEWAKNAQKCVEVEAYIALENTKSTAMVERLNFHLTGDLREGAQRYTLKIQQK